MRLAAKALADMPLLILSPILPVVFYAALMVYCVAIGLFLASSGDFDKETFSSVPSACSGRRARLGSMRMLHVIHVMCSRTSARDNRR
jgi:hypothetical protein